MISVPILEPQEQEVLYNLWILDFFIIRQVIDQLQPFNLPRNF